MLVQPGCEEVTSLRNVCVPGIPGLVYMNTVIGSSCAETTRLCHLGAV